MIQETDIKNILKIGENDHDYCFADGMIHGRWFGFAIVNLGNEQTGVFFLPGIGEGHMLGVSDRTRAIKLTGAIAQSSEHGYGGVARWFVPEELRGKPEEFICEGCGSVGCSGDCTNDFDFDYEDEFEYDDC
jgi:hypothetical protein